MSTQTQTPLPKMTEQQIKDEAIRIVNQERTRWQDAVCFVTDRVAFQMRPLIRKLRKNYWGIFDIQTDPLTGRDKTWVPLTRVAVDANVKNADVDTKDISTRAKNSKGYTEAKVVRAVLTNHLQTTYFGEDVDQFILNTAIDGTGVMKFIKAYDKEGKPYCKRVQVDLLNVYIDPNAKSIQDEFRFTERALALPDEIAAMDSWWDTENLIGSTTVSRIDGNYTSTSNGTTASYRDLWETWGKIPKYLLTGNPKDKELVEGHIVVSGLEAADPKCHYIEGNPDGIKPYEEWQWKKIANRWYGLGIAERLLALQAWMNTIVNIRINRSYVSQLGLFKIRKGSGITPQILSRLGANGAIVVNDPSDIEQMAVQEASQASYADEDKINDWAQRDSGAFDISVGDPTPASKPATTSVIENNAAKSGFGLIKDGLGAFIERAADRHILPVLGETIKVNDVIELVSDDTMNEIIENIVAADADNELEKLWARGIIPSQEQMMQAIETAKKKLSGRPNIFLKTVRRMLVKHTYTRVFVTNETIDPSVIVSNLTSILKFLPQQVIPTIVKEITDLMGLSIDFPRMTEQAPAPQLPPQQANPQSPLLSAMNNPQPQSTEANTL